ncbi:hypothetical protein HispidOSU_016887 [Sigmodon hispidus]
MRNQGLDRRHLILLLTLTLILLPGVPQDCQCAPPPHSDVHFLCFNFTVEAYSRPGMSWLNVQCSIDEMPLLEYDNVNRAKLMGNLGEEVSSTKAWTDLTQTLEERGQTFRKMLSYITMKTTETMDHPTLQVNMCCQNEREQNTGASLLFIVNKETFIVFDAKNMTWTEINPKGRSATKEWEDDKELGKDLKMFSMGDCSHWLNEFLKHLTEIPRPTVKMLDAVQPTSYVPDNRGIIREDTIAIIIVALMANLFTVAIFLTRTGCSSAPSSVI